MKAKGSEILDFYNNHWPEGYFNDDYSLNIGEGLDPDKEYDLEDFGLLVPAGQSYMSEECIEFEDTFWKWKVKQSAPDMVTITKAEYDLLLEYRAKCGCLEEK
jgi:hypothetical protein